MSLATAEPRRALPRDDADDEDDDLTDLTIDALDDESWDLDESDDDDLEDWDDLEDDVEQHDDAPLARAPRRRSPSSDASPPKSTAFVMLGVTVLVAAAVFLARRLRIRRRASRDAPRVPTLAADGAAPRKACEHCGATAPKSPGPPSSFGGADASPPSSAPSSASVRGRRTSRRRPVESDASACAPTSPRLVPPPPPSPHTGPPRTIPARRRRESPRLAMRWGEDRRSARAVGDVRAPTATPRRAGFLLVRALLRIRPRAPRHRLRRTTSALSRAVSSVRRLMAGHGLIRLRSSPPIDVGRVGIARSMRHRGEANALVAMGQLAATREPRARHRRRAPFGGFANCARDQRRFSEARVPELANTTVKRGDRVAGRRSPARR